MERVSVSVIIVTFNSAGTILNTLDSLSFVSKFSTEIIIVDNSSTDNTIDVITRAKKPHSLIALRQNVGFGAAVNEAASRSQGRFLVILNPDACIETSVESALELMEERPSTGVMGGIMRGTSGNLRPSAGRFPVFLDFLFPSRMYYPLISRQHCCLRDSSWRKVDWIEGSLWLVRRSSFLEVGGFDEHYFLYVEDIDLCRRFTESGYTNLQFFDLEYSHEGGFDATRLKYLHDGFNTYAKRFHGPIIGEIVRAALCLKRIIHRKNSVVKSRRSMTSV